MSSLFALLECPPVCKSANTKLVNSCPIGTPANVIWVFLTGECTTIDGRRALVSGLLTTVNLSLNDAKSFAKLFTSVDFLLSSKAISSSTG